MRLRDSGEPFKSIVAAIRKYWHNHRLINSLDTINAGTDAA